MDLLYLVESRELEVSHLSAVPAGVLGTSFQRRHLTQACFIHESLLLALPKEVSVLLGEGPQVLVLVGVEVEDVLGVVLYGFAVSEESGPHCGPAGVENFLLRHVRTEFHSSYSKTQSSY